MSKKMPQSNALAAEGIMAAKLYNPILSAGSTKYASRSALNKAVASLPPEIIAQKWNDLFLSMDSWINLGDGWFQTTHASSGKSTHCGLHSLIESINNQLFVCLYEPRTREALVACASNNPLYDLEVSAKIVIKSTTGIGSSNNNNNKFQLIFAFKTIHNYAIIRCDTQPQSRWMLIHMRDGEEVFIAEAKSAFEIKANQFWTILLQVRESRVSIDVNGSPIFTSVRFLDSLIFNGLVGLQCGPGSKFAVKGWKLRGIDMAAISSSTSFSNHSSKNNYHNNSNSKSPIKKPNASPTGMMSGDINDNGNASKGATGSSGVKSIVSLADMMNKKLSYNNINNNVKCLEYLGQDTSDQYSSVSVSSVPTVFIQTRLGDQPVPWGGGGGPTTTTTTTSNSTCRTFGDIALPSSSSSSHKASSGELENRINQAMASMLQRHPQTIVETVFRDVVQNNLGVTFDDIAALSTAKRLLNEAVVLPLMMPEFFTGIREPWKGVLLFGPPGTGKTLLAKAVCSFHCSAFFSCSASSLISKYRGDSEKIVRCLFEAARACAPAIVFLDEIDALMSTRGMDGEHEASRRLKTELFAQMDGLSGQSNSGVMVLATTNCPWDLDEALRRRLEKRIYIPLPDLAARVELFSICLRGIPAAPEVDPRYLATLSDGYSGADVHIVCREASMMPLRRIMDTVSPAEIQEKRLLGTLTLAIPKVLLQDFQAAIASTRPSVSFQSISKFTSWDSQYGSI